MRRSLAFALLLAVHSAGCQKKDAAQTVPSELAAGGGEPAKPESAASANAATVETPPSGTVSKEHAATVKALQAELEASARKLAVLHEKVAKIAGAKKASAEKSLAEVDSAHVNIQADLAKLDGPEVDDFDDARVALEAGIKAFRQTVDAAEAKMGGKPAH